MKSRNKIESYNLIKKLSLNRFPEKVFRQNEEDSVLQFIAQYPADYYAIRDKSKSGGVFKLKVSPENVLQEIDGYEMFSINVSSYNYVDSQLLVGEIVVSGNQVNAILSTNKEYSVRDAIRDPDFNFTTDIFDNKLLNDIPQFDKVFQYICDKNLEGVVVEFAYFDKPIGVNKENIIIYELRTDY